MTEEDELFLQEMQGVKKLQTQERVPLRRDQKDNNTAARRSAAVSQETVSDKNHLRASEVPRVLSLIHI